MYAVPDLLMRIQGQFHKLMYVCTLGFTTMIDHYCIGQPKEHHNAAVIYSGNFI
jgi:hypothetical protein